MLTEDEELCRQRLQRWLARFDELKEMYDKSTGRMLRDQPVARERYATLKRDLGDEYKAGANSRRVPADRCRTGLVPAHDAQSIRRPSGQDECTSGSVVQLAL